MDSKTLEAKSVQSQNGAKGKVEKLDKRTKD